MRTANEAGGFFLLVVMFVARTYEEINRAGLFALFFIYFGAIVATKQSVPA